MIVKIAQIFTEYC